MATIGPHEVRPGDVIHRDNRNWLVLGRELLMVGWSPPWEFHIRALPSGPTATIRMYAWREWVEVMDVPESQLTYLCDQHEEQLLLNPKTNEVHAIPVSCRSVWPPELESGTLVRVRWFR